MIERSPILRIECNHGCGEKLRRTRIGELLFQLLDSVWPCHHATVLVGSYALIETCQMPERDVSGRDERSSGTPENRQFLNVLSDDDRDDGALSHTNVTSPQIPAQQH